jgi:hypothetical protein
MRAKREFFGLTYAYNLGALAGVKEVGVIKTPSSGYMVGFCGKKAAAVATQQALLRVGQRRVA